MIETTYNSFRCTNSDPNYGTTWFHFRSKPYDTPNTVLKTALFLMTFEISSAQPLYVRAVARYVQRCLQKNRSDCNIIIANVKIENVTSKIEVKSHEVGKAEGKGKGNTGDGSITVALVVSDSKGEDTVQDNREVLSGEIIQGADASQECVSVAPLHSTLVNHSPTPLKSRAFSVTDNHDTPVLTGLQEQLVVVYQREAELLEDFSTVLSHQKIQNAENNRSIKRPGRKLCDDGEQRSGAETKCVHGEGVKGDTKLMAESWPIGFETEKAPLVILEGGSVYCSPDFVTASIEMNRAMFSRHLNQEEKRKVLFGSDQIIP